MSVLMWVAVLVGAWCVASVIAALALGAFMRHRGEVAATRFETFSRLEAGPSRIRFAEMFGTTYESPSRPVVPAVREVSLPSPRTGSERLSDTWARDPELLD